MNGRTWRTVMEDDDIERWYADRGVVNE